MYLTYIGQSDSLTYGKLYLIITGIPKNGGYDMDYICDDDGHFISASSELFISEQDFRDRQIDLILI